MTDWSPPVRPSRARDGKTLRGTIPLAQTQGIHLVAAYLPDAGVVVAQLHVSTKENAMVVAPTILAHVDLTGMGVTGDAMSPQRMLSTPMVDAGGD